MLRYVLKLFEPRERAEHENNGFVDAACFKIQICGNGVKSIGMRHALKRHTVQRTARDTK